MFNYSDRVMSSDENFNMLVKNKFNYVRNLS